MIVVDNVDEDLFVMATDQPDSTVTLPCVLMGLTDGNTIIGSIKDGTAVTLTGPIQFVNPSLSSRSMARFSSRGPTPDGRFKPDVVAPGSFIVSAKSDGTIVSNQCVQGLDVGVLAMEGTSMATPVTSGTAALVRQYYMDGYYPSGTANPSDSLVPSAALLKATLIASTASQSRLGASNTLISGPPSVYQGFGRLLLEAGLVIQPIPTDPADGLTGHSLWVNDSFAATTGSLQSFCFKVTPTALLRSNPICSAVPNSQTCYRPFKATVGRCTSQ